MIPLFDFFKQLRDESLIIKWIESNNDTFIRNINIGNKYGKTALHYAVKYRHRKLVKLLIKHNVDVNIEDSSGSMPFEYMINEDIPIVKMLIKAGVDINRGDKDDDTPLHIASYFGNKETVKLLIKAGANLYATNDDIFTALDCAIQQNVILIDNTDYIKIIKLLLNALMF